MSYHCHDEHIEHSGHGHGHHHHDHGHENHDHSDDIQPALQYSLYRYINFDGVTCLNELEVGSGRAILKKTWVERLQLSPVLESDIDEQLLIHIPCVFSQSVSKLLSLVD